MVANLRKRLITSIRIGIITVCVIFCLFVIEFLVVTSYAQSSARSLAPPEYPNSELVATQSHGGTDSIWLRRTYRTSDSVDQVLLFMEAQMPGFTETSDSESGIVYQNDASNTNWLAHYAAEYFCTGLFCVEKSALLYPSAGVTLYSDPDKPTDSLIQVWVTWPAP